MEQRMPYSVKEKHIMSMLDVVLAKSQDELIRLRKELANDIQLLNKRERDFIAKECAKLANIGSLQQRLGEYREKHASSAMLDKRKEASALNNSTILGMHLRAVGKFKIGMNWHAHHIVCSRHASHAASRFMLFAYLGINDPENGCWLPKKHKYAANTVFPNAVGHDYVHTGEYASWVFRRIRNAGNKQALINGLRDVRLALMDTKNLPDSVLTNKGHQDLRIHN